MRIFCHTFAEDIINLDAQCCRIHPTVLTSHHQMIACQYTHHHANDVPQNAVRLWLPRAESGNIRSSSVMKEQRDKD